MEKKNLVIINNEKIYKDNDGFYCDNLDDSYRSDRCHFNRKGIDKISNELASEINSILKK